MFTKEVITLATFRVWKSANDQKWHWHLKSDKNGKIICWAEAYESKQGVLDSIEWVKKYAAGAKTED